MSTVERNKGKLIPVDPENVVDSSDEDLYDDFRYNHIKIGDKWFKIEKTIATDYDSDYFCDIVDNKDGTFDFHSMHYNGGGSLSEVLGDEMKKKACIKHADDV